LTNATMCTM